jgi:geranylgeranyl pyrophosphate synthase
MDDIINKDNSVDDLNAHPSGHVPVIKNTNIEVSVLSLITSHLPKSNDIIGQAARHHFHDSGKMLRAKLALSAHAHIGGSKDAAMYWAAAIEVMHNASLVHDDISDGDQMRRNRPSVWFKFGRDVALALGDWLIGLSFELAAKAADISGRTQLVHVLCEHMMATTRGQAKEFDKNAYPGRDTYKDIILGKTAPLFIAPLEGVAIMGNRADIIPASRQYFQAIGSVYQVANDLLNFAGADGAETSAADLIRRAPNAVIVLFREQLSLREAARFNAWLSDGKSSDLTHWLDAIMASDAISQTVQMMEDMLADADKHYQNMPEFMRQVISPIQKLIYSVRIKALTY